MLHRFVDGGASALAHDAGLRFKPKDWLNRNQQFDDDQRVDRDLHRPLSGGRGGDVDLPNLGFDFRRLDQFSGQSCLDLRLGKDLDGRLERFWDGIDGFHHGKALRVKFQRPSNIMSENTTYKFFFVPTRVA